MNKHKRKSQSALSCKWGPIENRLNGHELYISGEKHFTA